MVFLQRHGGDVVFARPVRGFCFDGDRAVAIETAAGNIHLSPEDAVILAAPPWIAQTLVPDLTTPDRFNTIVNGHFAFSPPAGAKPIVGVIGGAAEWVFAFTDRLSVTVSAADAIADDDREDLARRFWADVAAVYDLPAELPPWRIIKERRATFAATPEQDAKRPPAATRWRNLILAGDWTATGLPATIEGAIRSGGTAAALTLETRRRSS